MSLQLKGRLLQILPVQSGTSKAGNNWSKQEFVLETVEEQFPRQVCFTLFGDKVSLLGTFKPGDEVEVAFNVESREFSGRWYHNINAWRITPAQQQNQGYSPVGGYGEIPPPPPAPTASDEPSNDDLPF